jgi:hypothetical protein
MKTTWRIYFSSQIYWDCAFITFHQTMVAATGPDVKRNKFSPSHENRNMGTFRRFIIDFVRFYAASDYRSASEIPTPAKRF